MNDHNCKGEIRWDAFHRGFVINIMIGPIYPASPSQPDMDKAKQQAETLLSTLAILLKGAGLAQEKKP